MLLIDSRKDLLLLYY